MTAPQDNADYLGRILDGNGSPIGTCFQVSPGVLVTAWHVLEAANAASVGDHALIDPIRGGETQQATVHAIDQAHDLAVLKCPKPLQRSIRGLIPTATVSPNTAIAIMGAADLGEESLRYVSTTGSWQGSAARSNNTILGQATSPGAVAGMGGAPVRRATDDFVVGVLSARYNSVDGWLRDTIWVARTEDIQPLLADASGPSGIPVAEGHSSEKTTGAHFRLVHELKSPEPLTAVATYQSPESTIVVAGAEDGSLNIWDVGLDEPKLRQLTADAEPIWGVAVGIVADRPTAVSVGRRGDVRTWDLSTEREVESPLTGHTDAINAVAVGYLGEKAVAVTGSDDNTLRLWDISSRQQMATLTGHDGWINGTAVVVDNDKSLLAVTGSSDKTVGVWDVESQRQIEALRGHTASVSSVAAISANGELIVVSGSNDATVRVWRANRDVEQSFTGHQGRVRTVAIGVIDDSLCAVSGGDDGTVRIWPLAEPHSKPEILVSHAGSVRAVTVVSVDGRPCIASAGDDGTLRIWETAAHEADQVEWLSDSPAPVDLLGRLPLAQSLATRLRRMHHEQPDKSFLIHLDGQWGSGKSTLLGFMRADLAQDWTVVDFNAWRESAVGPPWWALLVALRRDVAKDMGWLAKLRLRTTESWSRIRRSGAPFVLAVIALMVVVVAVFLMLGTSTLTLKTAGEAAKGASAAVVVLGAVWAGTLVASRVLLWNSARGARLFEQSGGNPIQSISEHFGWLAGRSRRSVVFFIDDLDRCPQKYVVELLEAIQTIIRDAPERDRRGSRQTGPCFVVAADGCWVRKSFEVEYEHFAESVAEPGKPLGYLFLDKIFQLRVPMPMVDPVRQHAFLGELLRVTASESLRLIDAEESKVREALRQSSTEAQVVKALHAASPIVRSRVAASAVDKLTGAEIANSTEHNLQRFGRLLAPNARSMKKFVNMYSVLRAVRTLEGNAVGSDALALWTVIEARWPSLADYLRASPESVMWIGSAAGREDEIPKELLRLFDSPALLHVVRFDPDIRFTPTLVSACCGAGFPPGGESTSNGSGEFTRSH